MKTSESTESTIQPSEKGVEVGGSSRARRDGSELDGSKIDSVEFDDGEVENNGVEKKVQKLSKSKNLSKSKKTIGLDFFTPGTKLAFAKLRQSFVKALIFYHFDLERLIRIETDASGYAIGEVFHQLTSNNLGRWYPVAFFSRKMIPAETRYKTHDGKLSAIIEGFKTWKHYLEGFQHKVFILIDHNNLCRFMDWTV